MSPTAATPNNTAPPGPLDRPAAVVTTMPLTEMSARFALILAYEGTIKDYAIRERAALNARLIELSHETGTKSIVSRYGDTPLATFTLKENKDTIVVTDPDALCDWVIERAPVGVETVTRVRDSYLKVLLSKVDGSDLGVFDPETGDEVPGLTFRQGGPPSSFGTTWAKDGKEAAMAKVFATTLLELGMEG